MPVIFLLDDIKADIEADFAVRGLVATVEIGEWSVSLHAGASRVIVALGNSAQGGQLGGRHTPGAHYPTGAGTVARAHEFEDQHVIIWVHGAASGVAPDQRARGDRYEAAVLKSRVISALRRRNGGPLEPWTCETLNHARDGVTYGAAFKLDMRFRVPHLDDELDVVGAGEVDTTTTIAQDETANATVP